MYAVLYPSMYQYNPPPPILVQFFHASYGAITNQLKPESHHGSTNNSGGFCWLLQQSRPRRLCEPDSQLSHTSHTCRLHFSVPRSPLMWPCRPGDKRAQTWKTLRLAKNNKLSTDLLSRNANTKCSLCCNYIHFDRNSMRDSFLYSSVNARFVGSMICSDILWHQVAC